MTTRARRTLSPLEQRVMDILWVRGACTADDVRRALRKTRLTDSTVRTLLRRMETKGHVAHRVSGRTFVYRPALPPQRAAVRAVREALARFCGGSLERLLVGLVEDRIVSPKALRALARRIERAGESQGTPERHGNND